MSVPAFYAIAAMSENRVIGDNNHLPWHLPEEYRWFKNKTMGGTLIMGRKTFASIGKPLPGRKTVVLSRSASIPGVEICSDLASLEKILTVSPAPHWICGGVEIYRQFLDKCERLYLTRIKKTHPGDAFFPPFEDHFLMDQVIHENADFRVERWKNKGLFGSSELAPELWPFAQQ